MNDYNNPIPHIPDQGDSNQPPVVSHEKGKLEGRTVESLKDVTAEEETIDALFENITQEKTPSKQQTRQEAEIETNDYFSDLPPELLAKIGKESGNTQMHVTAKKFMDGFDYQIPSLLKGVKDAIGEERAQKIIKKLPEPRAQLKALIVDQRERLKGIVGGPEFLDKLALEHPTLLSEKVVGIIEKWIQKKQDRSLTKFVTNIINNNASSFPKLNELKNLDANEIRAWMKENPVEINNIKQIVISDKTLDSLPPEIGLFSEVTKLTLMDTNLKSLPSEIANMKNLEALIIIGTPTMSLPSHLVEIPKLTKLYLNSNKFEAIPSVVFKLANLQVLHFNNNNLTKIPQDIYNLKNLDSVNFDNNKISAVDSSISQLNNLVYLSLNGNKLTTLPPEIAQIKHLNYLDIRNNPINSLPDAVLNIRGLLYTPKGRMDIIWDSTKGFFGY